MCHALHRWARFSTLLILILISACAKQYPIAGSVPVPRDGDTGNVFVHDVQLLVESRYSSDFVVYVLSGGVRTRLGSTTGPSTRRFAIPKRVFDGATQIRLIAEMIGGPTNGSGERTSISSGGLVIRPRQRIEWVLESVSGSAVRIF